MVQVVNTFCKYAWKSPQVFLEILQIPVGHETSKGHSNFKSRVSTMLPQIQLVLIEGIALKGTIDFTPYLQFAVQVRRSGHAANSHHVLKSTSYQIQKPDPVMLCYWKGSQGSVKSSPCFCYKLLSDQKLQIFQPNSWHLVHCHKCSLKSIVQGFNCWVRNGQPSYCQEPFLEICMP